MHGSWTYLAKIFCFVFRKFGTDQPIRMFIDTDACRGSENQVNYLEHMQAFVTLKTSYRGNTVIYLTSPMNTTYVFLLSLYLQYIWSFVDAFLLSEWHVDHMLYILADVTYTNAE
jgi:hypothetical protein